MKSLWKKSFLLGLGLATLAALALVSLALMQGIPQSFWPQYNLATVHFDGDGIPTVEAPDWNRLIETQGFVIASERLWQMDLLRRKASGRLGEWFGSPAAEFDLSRRKEGWIETADAALAQLSSDERNFCSAYAAGINNFISSFPWQWGIEYTLLRVKPDFWSCRDSLLIVMLMADELSSSAQREASQTVWRRSLSTAWEAFLFPTEHPWNQPMFGFRSGRPLAIPSKDQFLPPGGRLYRADERVPHKLAEQNDVGSNSWSWQSPDQLLLANDPHLGTSVPGIWYGMRLRISAAEWVVGAALPGVPGIILGMNSHFAWAFTNTGEDVDDYLGESISDDGQSYLVAENGQGVWKKIIRKPIEVKVRGEEARLSEALFTHRGPLTRLKSLGNSWYSRRWLALDPGSFGLPAVALNRAKDWEGFNHAIDRLTIPSQNILYADRAGNLGYRQSGRGIKRSVSGQIPQPAEKGDWLGFDDQGQRLRQYFPRPEKGARVISTANQRIWVDNFGHHFADDSRQARIQEYFSEKKVAAVTDFHLLQIDTFSHYHRLLLNWILAHTAPTNTEEESVAKRWRSWSGEATADYTSFGDAVRLEFDLVNLLLGKVEAAVAPQNTDLGLYWCLLRRAWLLRTLETDEGMSIFGFSDDAIARWLMARAAASNGIPYYTNNRWQSQHPFVGRLPILGQLFRVGEFPQFGFDKVVRVESPKFGASMRLIWDLKEPTKSTWIFPVGQSGHVGSMHYSDLQLPWHSLKSKKVFADGMEWAL